MESDPDITKALSHVVDWNQFDHVTYTSISDPEENDGSDVLSFDEDDMFALDNHDDIVFPRLDPDENTHTSFNEFISADRDSDDKTNTFQNDVNTAGRDSGNDVQTSSDDLFRTNLDSDDNAQSSVMTLVRH
jgi:hypothetical protein